MLAEIQVPIEDFAVKWLSWISNWIFLKLSSLANFLQNLPVSPAIKCLGWVSSLRTPPPAAKDSRDQAAGQAKQFEDEKHPE